MISKLGFLNSFAKQAKENKTKQNHAEKSHNLDEWKWHRKSVDVPCREHWTGPGAGTQLGVLMGGLSTNVTIPFPGQNLTSGSKSSGSATEMKSPSLCVTIDVTLIITYKEESY